MSTGKASRMKQRLILNRLRPPRSTKNEVSRAALLAFLEEKRETRVVVVHAPAGFGKTSLLVQYFDYLVEKDSDCGWLSLDPACQDPVQILAHILASLNASTFLAHDVVNAAFRGLHGLDQPAALSLTVNALCSSEDSVDLFIDDFHVIEASNALKTVQTLIELTNPNIRFLISSREFPTAIRSRAQLSGELVDLSTSELAFTEIESRELLALPERGRESEALAEAIHRKTEGWPAALEFARLWVDRQPNVALSSFVDQSKDFVSFLFAEILEPIPDSLKEVMLQTAVLDSFCPDLINFACETSVGWTLVDQLANRNLLTPANRDGTWHRYNNLFGNFLLSRFRMNHADEIQGIHARAARWYSSQDRPEDALRHSVASGDSEIMLQTTELAGGWHMVLDGRISTIRSLLDALSHDDIRRYPMSYLGYLFLLAKSGNVVEAMRLFSAASFQYSNESHDQRCIRKWDLNLESQIVGIFLALMSDQPNTPARIASMEDVLTRLVSNDHFLRANVTNYLCYAYFDASSFSRAYSVGEQAIQHYRELNSIYGENFMYFHLGKICLAQGRLRDAEHLFVQGENLAAANFGDDNSMISISAAHFAELALEKNDVEKAQQYLETAFARIEKSESWFDNYLSAYFSAAAILQSKKQFLRATRTLRRACVVGRQRGLRRLRLFALCRYVYLLAYQGRIARANWILRRLSLESVLGDPQSVNLRVLFEVSITIAYCKLRSSQPNEAQQIVSDALALARKHKSKRMLIELHLLMAIVRYAKNKKQSALRALDAALSYSVFEGFRRPFIKYGPQLLPILDLALADYGGVTMNQIKKSFIANIAKIIAKEMHDKGYRSDSRLSRREREIVRYVSEGCSNKEIAHHCNCSVNTVKFHMKNIFLKLNVKNRKDVAAIAYENDFAR